MSRPRRRRPSPYPAPGYCTPYEQGSGSVYFIRAVGSGFIKIGIASGDPADRLATLQCGCPFLLEIVARVDGGRRLEAGIHGHFGHLRQRGEWFKETESLRDLIAAATNADALGLPVPLVRGRWSARRAGYAGRTIHYFPEFEEQSLCGSLTPYPFVNASFPPCRVCERRLDERFAIQRAANLTGGAR